MMFSNLADIGSQIRGGKVKALAVTVPRRASTLPGVPTMPEAGLPDFEITSWFGLLAPAGTPAPIIGRLNAETVKVLGRADVKATLAAQGLEVAPGSPEQFAAHIKSEIARFTKILNCRNQGRVASLPRGFDRQSLAAPRPSRTG
jgi:tripartite-type tricarboxylate transporter receptor subunit TctC